MRALLAVVEDGIRQKAARDWVASRGEYLSALLIANYLGAHFVDTEKTVKIREDGRVDESTYQLLAGALDDAGQGLCVLPGFYGSTLEGELKTFSRGGSDITGAIVARAVGAAVYENWSDVSGMLMADPRVVKDPKPIRTVTYRELRELAYMGATVLHDEAIFPVRESGIPVNIRNTNDPAAPGTFIVRDNGSPSQEQATSQITGVAGRKGFTIIALEKTLMNSELGFGRRLLTVLESNGVSFEHMPSGIDTICMVVSSAELEGKVDKVVREIKLECRPDQIDVEHGIALIATVGRGMMHTPGIAAKVMSALSKAGVNIRMIDQGSSELNIIVGVREADFENAVNAIYQAFVPR
jgi:aspartate kinase